MCLLEDIIWASFHYCHTRLGACEFEQMTKQRISGTQIHHVLSSWWYNSRYARNPLIMLCLHSLIRIADTINIFT